MRSLLTLVFLTAFCLTSFSQEVKATNEKTQIQDSTYTYAYILVEGKAFRPRRVSCKGLGGRFALSVRFVL